MLNKINKQWNEGTSGRTRIYDFFNKDTDLVRLFIIMIMVVLLMGLSKPGTFLTLDNFSSMAFQFPEFGIIALAMMLSMISGGIDLSIVGIANLSGVIASLIMVKFIPADASIGYILLMILVALVASLLVGMLCGLFNGFAIAKIGIPPILVTLGTMQLFTGIAIIITSGRAVLGLPEIFSDIGNGSIGIFPVPLFIFIVFTTIIAVVLYKTSFGLKLYMMGTNPTASRFSGINNVRILLQTYGLSGILSAVAGILIVAHTNSAKADYGTSYILQAVLVAVMGGVNPNGGFGKISGIIMAILTLQFLSSGLNMFHVSNFLRDFIWGSVLLLVMVINFVSNNWKSKQAIK
jgi:simple sugar transport system permease protein